jgi:O-antigen/teichoic acid export membrane protein
MTKVIHIFFGIFNTVFINRYLGPALKGEYAYLLNIVNLLVLVLNLGIYQAYPFFKRKNIEEAKQKFINISMFQFCVYIVLAVILSLVMKSGNSIIILTLVPVMVLSRQLNFIVLIENINLRNFIAICNEVFYTSVLLIIFFFAPKNYMYIISLLYAKDIITILTILFSFKSRVSFKYLDFSLLRDTVKFGLYPMLTMLLITMNYQVDVLILKWFVSFEQIGYYTVGVGLADKTWLIPDAFKEVLLGKTARKDSIEEILLSIKISLYVCLASLVFITVMGREIIVLLYGNEYVEAYRVTVTIFAGIIPMLFFKLINTLFLAKGKQKFSFNVLLIAVVTNVIANFILIPYMGITGAALASVLSYSICGFVFLYIFIKENSIKVSSVFLIRKSEISLIGNLVKRQSGSIG